MRMYECKCIYICIYVCMYTYYKEKRVIGQVKNAVPREKCIIEFAGAESFE